MKSWKLGKLRDQGEYICALLFQIKPSWEDDNWDYIEEEISELQKMIKKYRNQDGEPEPKQSESNRYEHQRIIRVEPEKE